MIIFAMVLGLGLAGPTESSFCRNPPSRASDAYWDYIAACGCARLEAPSRASAEYDRFLKACSDWRQRNPTSTMSVAGASPRPRPSPRPSPSASPSASPKASPAP